MKTKEEIYREACAARDEKIRESIEKSFKEDEIKRRMVLQKFPDAIFEGRFVILGGLKFFYYLDKTEIALGFKNETYDYSVPIRDMAGLADFLDRFIRHEEGQRKYKEKKEKSILFKIYQAFRKFFKK